MKNWNQRALLALGMQPAAGAFAGLIGDSAQVDMINGSTVNYSAIVTVAHPATEFTNLNGTKIGNGFVSCGGVH